MRRKLAYPLLLSVLMLVVPASAFADKSVNGVPVLTTINELVDPKHAAVLVVDMQNEIVSTEGGYWRKDRNAPANPQAHQVAPAYRKLAGSIAQFLQQARRHKIPILYAEYVHRDENGKMVVNGPECWTHRNSAWVSCAAAGTWEARTIRELAPRRGDPVIQKSRANAFYNTYLDDILKDRSIKTVLLTGTAGGGCVFATAMGALERGYFATFVKDCVDQQSYLDSDLIKGRFPIHTSKEVFATWGDSADGKTGAAPEATKSPRDDAAAFKKCVLEFLRERLYTRTEIDEWLRPKESAFSQYDPLLGYRNANRRLREGLDDTYASYHYDDTGARRMINHADRPCRVNTYGSSYTDGEQVNDGETWQERLASHLGEPIRNYGVGGQTGYQSYLRMTREERRTPANYIILNLTPPYERQLFGWQSFYYTKSPKHPCPPMPYVRVNRARKEFREVSNPCPTQESLHRCRDLDWLYQTFQEDFFLQLMVARDLINKGRPQYAYRPITALAGEHGIDRVIDTPQALAEVINVLIAQESLYAALRTIDKVQEFADHNGKKVLYVLSYGFDNVETILRTGKRFDQEVVDLLRQRHLPYVDLIEAYRADFARYRVPFSQYAKRHLVGGHLSPMGNFFVAHASKDKLVSLMDPKPPAYDFENAGGKNK